MIIDLHTLKEELCDELRIKDIATLEHNQSGNSKRANCILIRLLEGIHYTTEECATILNLERVQVVSLEKEYVNYAQDSEFNILFQICKQRFPSLIKDYFNKYETNLLDIPECIVAVMKSLNLTRQQAKAWYHNHRKKYTINEVKENGYNFVLLNKTLANIYGAAFVRKDLVHLAEALGYGDIVMNVEKYEEILMEKENNKLNKE